MELRKAVDKINITTRFSCTVRLKSMEEIKNEMYTAECVVCVMAMFVFSGDGTVVMSGEGSCCHIA